MVIERPKMRNAEGMDLPHNRLPIVRKPTAVQVKQLHEVGLELREWEVKSLDCEFAASRDESYPLEPITRRAVRAQPNWSRLHKIVRTDANQPLE